MQAGFHNLSHYNRLFRRQTGLTPREYRQMHGGKYLPAIPRTPAG
jgi:AraC-like DNA-binding protein